MVLDKITPAKLNLYLASYIDLIEDIQLAMEVDVFL